MDQNISPQIQQYHIKNNYNNNNFQLNVVQKEKDNLFTNDLNNENQQISENSYSEKSIRLLRVVLLSLFVIQNCLATFLGSYSTRITGADGRHFVKSTAILSQEVCKFIISTIFYFLYLSHEYFFVQPYSLPQSENSSFFSNKNKQKSYFEYIFKKTSKEHFSRPSKSIHFLFPSFLYSIQGNLLLVAISNIDVLTYQIIFQTKILTTAIFSVFLLNNRSLSKIQWFSLFLLFFGVSIVSYQSTRHLFSSSSSSNTITKNSSSISGTAKFNQRFTIKDERSDMIITNKSMMIPNKLSSILNSNIKPLSKSTKNQTQSIQEHGKETKEENEKGVDKKLLGLIAVGIASITSGLGGVYSEGIVKEMKFSVRVRNVQNSFFGICVSSIIFLLKDRHIFSLSYSYSSFYGFFQGYTIYTILLILLQSIGGLLNGMIMKYSDSISKGFAHSLSLVLIAFIRFFYYSHLSTLSSSPSTTSNGSSVYMNDEDVGDEPNQRLIEMVSEDVDEVLLAGGCTVVFSLMLYYSSFERKISSNQ